MLQRLVVNISILIAIATVTTTNAATVSSVVQLTDQNWSEKIGGGETSSSDVLIEWMVEFYAPWCPACQRLQPIWEDFAKEVSAATKAAGNGDVDQQERRIYVGQVDITQNPQLSGRFMITALPTIYHIVSSSNNLEFRQYKLPRSKESLLTFITKRQWTQVEPLNSYWQSPDSFVMAGVGYFYDVSMGVRNLMTTLTDDYGLPTWSIYVLFGLVTIATGLVLGLVLVFCIDCIWPTASAGKTGAMVKPAEEGQGDNADKESDLEDEAPSTSASTAESDESRVKRRKPRRE